MMHNDKFKHPQLEKIENIFTTPPTYPTRAIAFNPDGSLLAVALYGGSIKILDAGSGRQITFLLEHTDLVMSVAFSPDGSFLASGSVDKTVKIWRTPDFSLVASLEDHTDYVYSVAFSPAGDFLASGSGDNTVKIWRTPDFSLVASLEEHTSYVNSVAFSPAGDFLASGSWDNTVKIWRTADFSLVDSLEEHTNAVNSVAFSPAGDFLASGSRDNTVKIWRTADFSLVDSLEGHTDSVRSVAFSPAGDFLASGSRDNTVKIWYVNDSYSLYKTIAGANSDGYYVDSVAFHPAGTSLAFGNRTGNPPHFEGVVSLWGASSRQTVFLTVQLPRFSILRPEDRSWLHHARLEILLEIDNDDSVTYTVQINEKRCDFEVSKRNDTADNHTVLALTLPQDMQDKPLELTVTAENSAGFANQRRTLFHAKEAKQQENPSPKAQPSPKKIFIPQRQLALVIGNQSYTQAPLANPLNDAQSMKQVLENKLRFEVHHHENCSKDTMMTAMQQFEESLKNTADADVALFFFAGHGLEVGGINYLIPTEREFHSGSDILYYAVKLSDVLKAMNRGGAMLNIIILDACRNNPFRGLLRDVRTMPSGGFTPVLAGRHFDLSRKTYKGARGVIIAFSTSPEHTASDGYGKKNSPYTQALLKYIDTPNLIIESFFKRVGEEVEALTNGRQEPWHNTNMRGDFYFNPQQ